MLTRKYHKKSRKTRKQYGGNQISDYQVETIIDILGKLKDAKDRIDLKYNQINDALNTMTFNESIMKLLDSTDDIVLETHERNQLAFNYGKVLEELPANLEEYCSSIRRLREYTNGFPRTALDLPDRKPASRPAYLTQKFTI
jgi:hypothetical protein